MPGGEETGIGCGLELRVEPIRNGRGVRDRAVPAIRDVVLIIGPIGHVYIDVEVRLPFVDRADGSANFRRVELCKVAIEVQVPGVRPPTGVLRAALVDATVARGTLMAVDVEDRYEQKVRAVEEIFLSAQGHVAEKHQPRIFPVNLSRVDSALSEDGRLACGVKRLGRECALF